MGLFSLTSNTLYWPGCYSSALLKDQVSRYHKILKKLGISHTTTSEIKCMGGILINGGYDRDARQLARKNFEFLKKKGFKKIITSCPLCYKTLTQDYKEMLPDWDLEVEFILIPIKQKVKRFHKYSEELELEQVIYHDPCYLGRYSQIYDEPRDILEILGYDVVELNYNKKDSLCSGACGNLPITNSKLADKIARNLIKQIRRTGINKIVTPDSQVYNHLKKNLQDTGIQVFEYSELVYNKLIK